MVEFQASTVIGMFAIIEATQIWIIKNMIVTEDVEKRIDTHVKRYHK